MKCSERKNHFCVCDGFHAVLHGGYCCLGGIRFCDPHHYECSYRILYPIGRYSFHCILGQILFLHSSPYLIKIRRMGKQNGRLLGCRRHLLRSQLHGNLTPAHADGCATQCFESVHCGSIFDPAYASSPANCHVALRPSVIRSFPRMGSLAHRLYGSAQTGMYPSALCCL